MVLVLLLLWSYEIPGMAQFPKKIQAIWSVFGLLAIAWIIALIDAVVLTSGLMEPKREPKSRHLIALQLIDRWPPFYCLLPGTGFAPEPNARVGCASVRVVAVTIESSRSDLIF